MVTFLFALVLSLIGSISFKFTNRETSYMISYGIRVIIFTLLMSIINIFWMCPVEPWRIFFALMVMLAVGNLIDWFMEGREGSSNGAVNSVGAAITSSLFLIALLPTRCDSCIAQDLYAHVNEQQIDSKNFDQSPVDEAHVRVISKKTALRIARQTISTGGKNYGALYTFHDDTMTIQMVNGELNWVAPMEFGGFWKQRDDRPSPGFIMISAENPQEKARIVTKHATRESDREKVRNLELRYMVHSYLGWNLMRHLYHLYPTKMFMEPTFEVDEQLHPHQVVTEVEPMHFGSRYAVKGVVVVNPETGEIEGEFETKNIPAWIDRVVPDELAVDYFEWWGEYQEGWVVENTVNPQEHLKKPTAVNGDTDVWMIYGSDRQPYWFTGFTSFSGSDEALIGKAYMNSRTGRFVYLETEGPNEQRIVQDVVSAMPRMNTGVMACAPIPYNIYGRPNVWVVPVVSVPSDSEAGDSGDAEGGRLVRVAIVDGDSSDPPIIEETRNQALLAFRRRLGSEGHQLVLSESSDLQKVSGIITHFVQITADGNTQFRFKVQGQKQTFSCDVNVLDAMSTPLEFAVPGTEVEVEFENTKELRVPVTRYRILKLTPIVSPVQARHEEEVRQQMEYEERWDEAEQQPTKAE